MAAGDNFVRMHVLAQHAPTPRRAKSSMRASRLRVLRPKRSSFQTVTVPQVIQHLVQLWPTGPRTTDTVVGEDPVTARGLQRGMLQVRILVNGADPWRIQHSPKRLP